MPRVAAKASTWPGARWCSGARTGRSTRRIIAARRGFPLDRGTCRDGILTCHWHAARFDLGTGGTFDQFADDVQMFPVDLRGEAVWIDADSDRDLKISDCS